MYSWREREKRTKAYAGMREEGGGREEGIGLFSVDFFSATSSFLMKSASITR